jgi:hypothetical protein
VGTGVIEVPGELCGHLARPVVVRECSPAWLLPARRVREAFVAGDRSGRRLAGWRNQFVYSG